MDTAIDIVVGDDGRGAVSVAVTLDEAAEAKLGDLSEELVLDDLRAAGWRVRGPRSADEVQFEATRAFDSPEQLGPIMRQLGPPFRDFRLVRKDGFAEATYELQGTIDLSDGIESFGDDELRLLLGGSSFGRTPEALALEAGRPLAEAVTFGVQVFLPGCVEETNGTREAGCSASWQPKLGDPPVPIRATSTERDTVAVLVAGAGAGAGVLMLVTLVLVLTGKLGTRRRNRRIWVEPEPHHRRLGRFEKVQSDEVGGVRVRRED